MRAGGDRLRFRGVRPEFPGFEIRSRAMQPSQTSEETLRFLKQALRDLDTEALGDVAESMAEVAHTAAQKHPDVPEFVQLETEFLTRAAANADDDRDFAQQAELLARLAELHTGRGAGALFLQSAYAWIKAGKPAAAQTQLTSAIERADDDLPTRLQAEAEQAVLRLKAGEDPEGALKQMAALAISAREAKCVPALARLILVESKALLWIGQLHDADQTISNGITELAKQADAATLRAMQATQAQVWVRLGRFDDALKQAQAGVLDDQPEAVPLEALGCVYAECGMYAKARKTWDLAIDAFHEDSDRMGKARVYYYMARLLVSEGKWLEADAPLSMAEAEFRSLGHAFWLAHTGMVRTEVLMGRNMLDLAEQVLSRTRKSPVVKASLFLSGAAFEMYGDTYRWTKRYREALEQYALSRDAGKQAGAKREYARGALNCAHMHLLLEEYALAETQSALAVGLLRGSPGPGLIDSVEAKIVQARVQLKRKKVEPARQCAVEALEAAEELNLMQDPQAARTQALFSDLRKLEQAIASAGA